MELHADHHASSLPAIPLMEPFTWDVGHLQALRHESLPRKRGVPVQNEAHHLTPFALRQPGLLCADDPQHNCRHGLQVARVRCDTHAYLTLRRAAL